MAYPDDFIKWGSEGLGANPQWGTTEGINPLLAELEPSERYSRYLGSVAPAYTYDPALSRVASRRFAPTWGSYLLGQGGMQAGTPFESYLGTRYPGTGAFSPTNINTGVNTGWNRAVDWSALNQQARMDAAAGATDPIAAAALAGQFSDPGSVQAMALSRMLDGGQRAGIFGRAAQNLITNLYNKWWRAPGGDFGVQTDPGRFLDYMKRTYGDTFGRYSTLAEGPNA